MCISEPNKLGKTSKLGATSTGSADKISSTVTPKLDLKNYYNNGHVYDIINC